MLPLPNYTQFPNVILDQLSTFTPTEFLLVGLICRKTFGFHREAHGMAISYIQDKTGLTRPTIRTGIRGLVEKGWIRVIQPGKDESHWEPRRYSLCFLPKSAETEVIDDSEPDTEVKTPDPVREELLPEKGKETIPQRGKDTDRSKETDLKEKGSKKSTPPVVPPEGGKSKDHPLLISLYVQAYENANGTKYPFAAGPDGAAAQRALKMGITPERFGEVARKGMRLKTDFLRSQCASLAGLVSSFSRIEAEVIRETGHRPSERMTKTEEYIPTGRINVF